MNLRELIKNKTNLVKEAKALLEEGKLAEAEAKKVEIENLNKQIEILSVVEEENEVATPVVETKKSVKDYTKEIFVNLLQNKFDPYAYPLTEDSKQVRNAFVEDPKTVATQDAAPTGASIAIPKDIQNAIKELRKTLPSLENICRTEAVAYQSGSRIFEANTALAPFPSVDEGQLFPNAPKPQFKKIEYNVKKFGDILKFTYEMTKDANFIVDYVKRWFARRGVATRNSLILSALDAQYTSPVAIDHLDDLKDIINVQIPVAEALSIKVVTNQDGFNFLDKLKYADGKYVLQPDPTLATKGKLLFGKHPIMVIDNSVLPNRVDDGTSAEFAPIFIGDMAEAVTIFDRENGTIDFSGEGSGLWDKDLIGMKGRERLDVKIVDPTAVVKGEIALA